MRLELCKIRLKLSRFLYVCGLLAYCNYSGLFVRRTYDFLNWAELKQLFENTLQEVGKIAINFLGDEITCAVIRTFWK